MYWDANNVYAWGMNQPLPYSNFNFFTKKEMNEFFWIVLVKIVQ